MRTLTTPSLWSRVAALFFFLLGLAPGLRAQTWQWATAAGPTGPGSAHASRSGLDATGNAFVTGYFSGTVSFGSTVLTSVGTDAFVAKLDANGAWLWAVRAGQAVPTGAGTQANGLAVSPDGSVTIAGQFEGTASFGGTSLNSAGSTDMFVAKLSGAGAWQWAIRGGGSGADVAAAVVAHPSGSFLGVAGSCSNGANFGGHIPDFMGGTEALVARVDPAGSWTWAVTAGGTGDDEALDLSVDVANATFQVVGSYIGQGFFSINSGLTILNSNFGSRDAFLGIVQMANPTWAGVSNIGGPGIQRALAVATAVNGDTYVTGTFETTADFITSTLTSSGGATEGFATCLSRATGRFRWSTRIGGAGADAGRAIAVDAAGNATVAGDFAGPATFDTLPLAGSGSSEAFVGRISAAGVVQWALAAGSAGADQATGLAVDAGGTATLAVSVGGPATFGSLSTSSPAGVATVAVARLAPVPTLAGFAPVSGPVGTSVRLDGNGLSGTTAVTVNGTAAPGFVVSLGGTRLTVAVPAGANTGPISLSTPGGAVATASSFTVTATPAPTVTAVAPVNQTGAVPRNSSVTVSFSQPISAVPGSLRVFGSQSGRRTGTLSASGNQLTFDPADFKPGEEVAVTATTATQSTGGAALARSRVWQFRAASGVGPGTFGSGTLLASGAGRPEGLAVADLDGDGDLDLVLANSTATSGASDVVRIRLNDGLGGFADAPDVVMGTAFGGSQTVRAADVDGDGDADLVSYNRSNTTVSVSLNNGTASFGPPQILSAGGASTSEQALALADVDGDGDLDILAVGTAALTFSVRINDGAGNFGGGSNVNIASGPQALAAADLDNDGDLDVVVTHTANNSVTVYANDGDGNYTYTGLVSGVGARCIALADVNHDGYADLVTGANATAFVRLGNGSGGFGAGSDVPVGNNVYSLAVADVDGDGHLDIVTANSSSSSLSVRRGSGTGTFAGTQTLPVGAVPKSVAVADLDGDGDLDLIAGSSTDRSVWLLLNQAPGNRVVSSPQTIVGDYQDLTITGPTSGGAGVATLGAAVTVSGTLRVLAGGTLAPNCQALTGPGSLVLADSATLRVCGADGISRAGASGAVQLSGGRSYSAWADYEYTGPATQVTGDGLPATVRRLTVSGLDVRLTNVSLGIHQLLRLASAGNLDLNGHALTLLSNQNGSAMVVNDSGGEVYNNGGTATMQRYVRPGTAYAGPGYRHYSSPVAAATVAGLAVPSTFAPNVTAAYNALPTPVLTAAQLPNVFGYDAGRLTATYPGFDTGWYSPAALTDALVPGLGYTLNIAPAATVALSGTFNNQDQQTPPLLLGTGSNAGWQLLGNPYPSPLSWDTVRAKGYIPFGMDDALYVFEPTSRYGGLYRSYVNGIGSLPNGVLPAMQSFFVRIHQDMPGGFYFTNELRLGFYANPVFRRPAPDLRPRLALALRGPATPAGQSDDETFVYFQAGATTTGIDAHFDAAKLANPGSPVLATRSGGSAAELLAVQGLPPLINAAVLVPLSLTTATAGRHTLTATTLLNFAPTQPVWLHDYTAGTAQDLRLTPAFTFTVVQPGLLDGRFALEFGSLRPTATRGGIATMAPLLLYPNPAHGTATLALAAAATARPVQVLDGLGRVVRQLELPASAATLPLEVTGLPAGVYVVRVGAATARLVVE